MIHSIRTKLFLQISIIILFFAGVNWIVNDQYLEQYYINQKRALLIEQADYIDLINEGNYREIAPELRRIEELNSLSINIVSSESQIRYSSRSRIIEEAVFVPDEDDFREFRPMGPPEGTQRSPSYLTIETERISQNAYFEMRHDPVFKMNFLAYHTVLKSGDTLEIMVILDAITESADIANQFIFYISLVVLVISGVWAFFASKQFTRPILEMNQITRKMSDLDFSQTCHIDHADEIGQLGASINYLSQQLSGALKDLEIKNKKLEQEIQRERKLVEMRKEFVSNVSHELRTPIALIGGYAEGLKLNILKDESKKNFYCDVILDETKKMNFLVGDLLDLSQVESGALKLNKTSFCLADAVQHLVEKFTHIFQERNLNVTVQVSETVYVYADIMRTDQILVNYLNNALIHVDEKGIIHISALQEEDKVVIWVYNSGEPIPETDREEIWHSFYKGNKARTRGESGYGLGLSIVAAIQTVDQNQWGFTNTLEGVEFWFNLDAAQRFQES